MVDESAYLPRIADELLESKLKQTGAVVIRGPKWCGKTGNRPQAFAECAFHAGSRSTDKQSNACRVEAICLAARRQASPYR